MKITILNDSQNKILKAVSKFDWKDFIPGGWLDYGPPRMVTGYGDGSLYTDNGEGYGFHYRETAWAASIPFSNTTAVVKTKAIPKNFLKTGILESVRNSLREYGASVDDHTATGLWCNYYSSRNHRISSHRDNEDYYEKNYGKEPLFVSLTLYEDGSNSLENLARFQIRVKDDWQTIPLPHLSILVMSGNIEHRVLESVKSKPFRKRYNITFRTPVKMSVDIIKNYRFFSNFGRYYRKPYLIYLPKREDKKLDKLKNSYNKLGKIFYKYNLKLDRNSLLEAIGKDYNISRPRGTTTNMALYILLRNLKDF